MTAGGQGRESLAPGPNETPANAVRHSSLENRDPVPRTGRDVSPTLVAGA